jgi:hypothetical protein
MIEVHNLNTSKTGALERSLPLRLDGGVLEGRRLREGLADLGEPPTLNALLDVGLLVRLADPALAHREGVLGLLAVTDGGCDLAGTRLAAGVGQASRLVEEGRLERVPLLGRDGELGNNAVGHCSDGGLLGILLCW